MITDLEKGAFLKLFNRGGYVLDFSTSDFDTFTMRSVGIALCAKYGLSKGKSLQAYLLEADQKSVVKLLKDLFDYYEMNFRPEFDEACQSDFSSYRHEKGMKQYYLICKPVIDRECAGDMHLNSSCEYIKQEFSSDFLNGQIDLMMTMRVENPTEAIGKAKELIESCCKTILERGGVALGVRP